MKYGLKNQKIIIKTVLILLVLFFLFFFFSCLKAKGETEVEYSAQFGQELRGLAP